MESTEPLQPLTHAGASYSLSAFVPVLLMFILSFILRAAGATGTEDWYLYCGFLVPQLSFAAVILVWSKWGRTPLKKLYTGCKWYYFVIALLLGVGFLLSLGELNGLFIGALEQWGYHPSVSDAIPSLDGWNLLPALLVIGLLPALMEETLFRGILCGTMERAGWGSLPVVLLSGALFSLFHGNPEQTLYQFVCGACFALVAVRSGSILPTILAHAANNAVILICTACGLDSFSALPYAAYLTLCLLASLCLAAALLFLFFGKRGKKGMQVTGAGRFFLTAFAGIVLCLAEWVMALLGGLS